MSCGITFFAKRVTTDEYLSGLCRYIDFNAVEAGRVDSPEEWPWSGCAATLGLVRPRGFHDVDGQLRHFGSNGRPARDAYRSLLLDSVPGKGYESVTECAA